MKSANSAVIFDMDGVILIQNPFIPRLKSVCLENMVLPYPKKIGRYFGGVPNRISLISA